MTIPRDDERHPAPEAAPAFQTADEDAYEYTRRIEMASPDLSASVGQDWPAERGYRPPAPGYAGYSPPEFPRQTAVPPAPSTSEGVLYVPLAVTVGDGFKFGCGFFMAAVITMLLGFVLLAALFLLTTLLGIPLVPPAAG